MEIRNCRNCKGEFAVEPDDFAFYEKLKVPPPTWCPECRFVRRLSFINHRSLYKRTCENCGKAVISMYSDDTPIPVWCVKCHVGDSWDGRDYGREYNFEKTFFEQFKELKEATPHRCLDQNERNGGGCEYSNYCFSSKDAYLSFSVAGSEYVRYSAHIFKGNKNCVDSLSVKESDRVYENVQTRLNYNSSFLIESDQCVESNFLFDCSNCVSCCMSSNLRNKSYVFQNKQLGREEYQKAVADLKLNTYSGQIAAKKEFSEMAAAALHRYAHITNSVNVVGDFIENSKNVYHSYGLVEAEDAKNVYFAMNAVQDSQDLMFCGMTEQCYEFMYGGRGAYKVLFGISCGGGCKNITYCDNCRGCSDCFGCVSLDKKQYCILNKQYTKEEYGAMVPKIIEHMNARPYRDKTGKTYLFGEFFPPEISPFAYNETVAFEEYPLPHEEIAVRGYRWKDPETKSYAFTLKSANIPDRIEDVLDSVCNEIIECPNKGRVDTQCTSAFKIIPDELAFYRQMALPVPRYCPNCRYHERLKWKNPFKFFKRSCMCSIESHGHKGVCPNEFETMYPPERPEKIFCKTCYQKEVY